MMRKPKRDDPTPCLVCGFYASGNCHEHETIRPVIYNGMLPCESFDDRPIKEIIAAAKAKHQDKKQAKLQALVDQGQEKKP